MTAAATDDTVLPPGENAADIARPARVAFIDHTARMGGGEIALLNLVNALDRRLVDPVVLLFSDGPLADALRAQHIETHILPLSAAVLDARKDKLGSSSLLKLRAAIEALRHVRRVAKKLHALHIDLVHTNSLKADLIGGLAGRLARRRVVWHVRDRIADDYLPRKVAWLFRKLCRVVPHFVLANSAATLKTLNLPAEVQTSVVPSGIRHVVEIIHDGTLSEAPGDSPRSGAPLIGIVGRISPWKGQHIFLQAAAKVHAVYPATRFTIVGTPLFGEEAYERELRELTQSLGLAEVVDFAGFTHDVPGTMRSLTILVHASTTGEPFGQVIIEAMAAGTPVVATDGGGVPEIVQDGMTGLLVPMSDVEAMVGAIQRLLADPAEAARMGARGRQRVLDHFTIGHTARKVEAVYRLLLKRGK